MELLYVCRRYENVQQAFSERLGFPIAEVVSMRITQVQQTIDLKVWDVCAIQKERKGKEKQRRLSPLEFLDYFCKSCPTECQKRNAKWSHSSHDSLHFRIENQTWPVEESLVSLPWWKGYPALGLSLSFVAMLLLSHPKKRKDCSKKTGHQKTCIWKLSLS